MPKTRTERPAAAATATQAPPLQATVRRHLGQALRGHYADTLTAPVSQRLEDLLARLDKPKV